MKTLRISYEPTALESITPESIESTIQKTKISISEILTYGPASPNLP